MNFEPIISGALPSPREAGELQYGQYSAKRLKEIPPAGGVGKIPLIIHHQHKLPSCTGEAGAYGRMISHYQETGRMVNLSPMFIYKMNRLFDGLSLETKGSTLKATMQTLQVKGACREKLYPSTKENCLRPFPNTGQGSRLLLADAAQYRTKTYARCENLDDILLALSDKRSVIFSMIIYTDFYMAENGRVSTQIKGDKIGGHSMVAMNYDLEQEVIQVVQSWGSDAKGPTDHGYMTIPFAWFRAKTEGKTPLLIEAFTMI